MKDKKLELPPFREVYVLTDSQQQIVDRFLEELRGRVRSDVSVEFWKENFLAYPSKHADTITVELTVGNWKRASTIIEPELSYGYGEPFYYFFRKLSDDVMADLLKRGASVF
jgi:hypothetical protein